MNITCFNILPTKQVYVRGKVCRRLRIVEAMRMAEGPSVYFPPIHVHV